MKDETWQDDDVKVVGQDTKMRAAMHQPTPD